MRPQYGGMSKASPASPRCVQTLATVDGTHRCPACRLSGQLQDANATISLLRREVARLSESLTRARAALYDESEAHALTHRRYQRLLADRDVMECDGCGATEQSACVCRGDEPDSINSLGLSGLVTP